MPSLTFRPRVPVFDANVRVGHAHDQPSPAPDRAALLAEMDAHGVDRALIYHAQTEAISPVYGNWQLEEWLDETDASQARLIPQWSIAPTAESLAQVQALHEQGMAWSVRLHDTQSVGLPFRPWAYGGLLSWLSDAGIPLWIPLSDADPDALVTTLQTFPHLVTVLVGAHYTHTLLVDPLLAGLPNAFLEVSRYEPIGQVEALCQEVGAERLIYGSWYPRYAMGPILFYLHHTDLSERELALICGGNLARILFGEMCYD